MVSYRARSRVGFFAVGDNGRLPYSVYNIIVSQKKSIIHSWKSVSISLDVLPVIVIAKNTEIS